MGRTREEEGEAEGRGGESGLRRAVEVGRNAFETTREGGTDRQDSWARMTSRPRRRAAGFSYHVSNGCPAIP
eukprot:6401736-Pyramimonas_sp.AAC.1